MSAAKSTHDVQTDNARARVTRWRLAADGGETGWHRHEYDYVIVPVTDGVLTITDPSGAEKDFPVTAGVSYFRQAGVEHNVANRTAREIVFVETEIK